MLIQIPYKFNFSNITSNFHLVIMTVIFFMWEHS